MTSFPMRRQPPWVGPVDLTGGSASNPSLSDAAEPDSGWYRAAEEDWRLSLGGVDQVQLTGANATTNLIAANVFARNIYTVTLPGTHSTSQWKAFYVNVGSPGSGGDGVANADVAVSVVAAKQSAQTTTTNGEIDGITINVVQGGTDNAGLSDCSCLLLNTQHIGTVGSGSLIEGMVQHFARAGPAIDLQFSSQIGVNLPSTTLPQSYGFNVVPSIGTLNYGYYVNGAVGTVANPFYYNGGTTSNVFFIDQNSNLRAAGSIGYPTGAGTAVIQSGTTASPVTANAICGTIKIGECVLDRWLCQWRDVYCQ
jgi:hypothetical protein